MVFQQSIIGIWSDGSKYIFATEDWDFYRQHSDNLELVTILECASAAGTTMSSYFVLKEGPLLNGTDPRLLHTVLTCDVTRTMFE
jgi:hypothetical protein